MKSSSAGILFALMLVFSINANNSLQYSINSDLSVALNSFSNNWNEDAAGTFIWISKLNPDITWRILPWMAMENSLKMAFGQTWIQEKSNKKWSKPHKSTDELSLLSILNFSFRPFVDPYLSLEINTQFIDDRDTLFRMYLNPAQFTESFGIGQDLFKSGKSYMNFRSGGAIKQTVERHLPIYDTTQQIIGHKSLTKNEGGVELTTECNLQTGNWFKFYTKLIIFETLIPSSSENPFNQYWRYPDVKWEATTNINITKYFILSYFIHLDYNRTINQEPSFKQCLGIGLTINFSNQE